MAVIHKNRWGLSLPVSQSLPSPALDKVCSYLPSTTQCTRRPNEFPVSLLVPTMPMLWFLSLVPFLNLAVLSLSWPKRRHSFPILRTTKLLAGWAVAVLFRHSLYWGDGTCTKEAAGCGGGQRKDKGLDDPWTFLSLVLCPLAGEMRCLSSQFPQLQKGSKTGITALIWG